MSFEVPKTTTRKQNYYFLRSNSFLSTSSKVQVSNLKTQPVLVHLASDLNLPTQIGRYGAGFMLSGLEDCTCRDQL